MGEHHCAISITPAATITVVVHRSSGSRFVIAVIKLAEFYGVPTLFAAMGICIAQGVDTAAVFLLIKFFPLRYFYHTA
jgi:hypothetical protein